MFNGVLGDKASSGERFMAAVSDFSALERAVEQTIRERTRGRVRDLHVTSRDDEVIIHGMTSSYYLKQLALEAARRVLWGNGRIAMQVNIEVDG
jgi:osmotically-inducible protein OsmY